MAGRFLFKKVIKMIITLTEFDTGRITIFPSLPEEINVECGTRFASYDIMNIGEIKIPLGEELTRFSWKFTLFGTKRQIKRNESFVNPYILAENDPKAFQEWLSYLRNSNIKCRLTVTDTPIDHNVYLEKYDMRYSGGYGDYECDIAFVHAKELNVSTEDKNGKGYGKAGVPADKKRPEKQQETSYTVKQGDCLWDIARINLGNGSRYTEIAELNGISNPNIISVGQTLLLPGD